MTKIKHRYIVSLQLLTKLEEFVNKCKEPSVSDIMCEYRRLKLFYRSGLVRLDD